MPVPLARRPAPELALALGLGIAVVAGAARALAGEEPRRPGAPPADPHPSVDLEMARVSDAVASLRGRSFDHVVPTRSMPCALAAARLLEIAKLEGARCSSDVERAVSALGFIDPEPTIPPQVGTERVRDSSEDAGPCGLAFYDQIRKEVIVVDGRSSSEERAEVLAHELSHALQDQLFDLRAHLRTIPRTPSGDHDAEELAADASVNEGEATAIELLYLWRRGDERSWIQGVSLPDRLAEVALLGGAGSGLGLRFHDRCDAGMRSIGRGTARAWVEQRRLGARSYYHALARFQYLVGASFVAEAYARGGWPMVDHLRSSPPTTTAELLHPERYYGGVDRPARVGPSELAKAASLRLLYENRLGELGTLVVTEGDADGWEGDRYRVLQRASDLASVIEARFVWRDAATAAKLQAALPRWLRTVHVAGSSIDVLERRGRAVVLAAGLLPAELGTARRALWAGTDAVGSIGVSARDDSALLLRHRASDGTLDGELRLLEARERPKVDEVLRAHLDAARTGTLETDGRSFGLRARPGGGVSWAEERADGRYVVATAPDRAGVKALREALGHLVPVESSLEPHEP